MRLRTRITFNDPWSQVLNDVAQQCGLSVDEYCRRAILAFTKKGLEAGEAERNGEHNTESGVPAGDTEQVSSNEGTDSSAFPDSESPGSAT